LASLNPYGVTVKVNFTDPVIGFEPPVVALTTMLELPVGVPGSFGVLEPPPQEDIHSADKPSRTINTSILKMPSERFREPIVATIPSSPGNSTA